MLPQRTEERLANLVHPVYRMSQAEVLTLRPMNPDRTKAESPFSEASSSTSPSLLQRVKAEDPEAWQRLLEQLFPGGFGALANDVRSW